MANINLRPWREELRQEKQKEFILMLVLAGALAFAVVWFSNMFISGAVSDQKARNTFISAETAILDKQIEEIKKLRETRQLLTERMKLIQDLQGNRPVIVRTFDELVKTLPDGLYYNTIEVLGTNISIKGKAETNGRISALMRNFDESEWFGSPNLIGVEANKNDFNNYQLTVQQTTPKAKEDE